MGGRATDGKSGNGGKSANGGWRDDDANKIRRPLAGIAADGNNAGNSLPENGSLVATSSGAATGVVIVPALFGCGFGGGKGADGPIEPGDAGKPRRNIIQIAKIPPHNRSGRPVRLSTFGHFREVMMFGLVPAQRAAR